MEDFKKEKKNIYEGSEDEISDSKFDQEIKAGKWQRLRESRTYRKRLRQGKIIATHQTLSNRIKQLETLFYQLVSNHPQRAPKLLKEIKRLRF